MEKITYTKDELRFIDNCAHCLSTHNVFHDSCGHILTIYGFDKNENKINFKDYLFKLNIVDFDNIQNKFNELIIKSKETKKIHNQLCSYMQNVGVCKNNW